MAARRPGRTLVGSVRVMRQALARARTVRQAHVTAGQDYRRVRRFDVG